MVHQCPVVEEFSCVGIHHCHRLVDFVFDLGHASCEFSLVQPMHVLALSRLVAWLAVAGGSLFCFGRVLAVGVLLLSWAFLLAWVLRPGASALTGVAAHADARLLNRSCCFESTVSWTLCYIGGAATILGSEF